MTTQFFYFSTAGTGSRADVIAGNGVYVAEDVMIGSQDDYCLTGTGSGMSFDIDGTVYGDLGGISLTSTTSTSVRIGDNGVVSGDLIGGTAFNLSAADVSIENRGGIRGNEGFEITGDSDVTISNFGTIRSAHSILHTDTTAVGSVAFINYGRVEQSNGFTISNDFYNSEGKTSDSVLNLGIINGELSLGDGKDAYYGTQAKPMDGGIALIYSILGETDAKIASFVDAGGGDDQLLGGKYVDYFIAGLGNDSVSGGGGDDVLIGGGGADTLIGGSGGDEFLFSAANDSHDSKVDEITDFSHKQHDKLAISFDAKPKTGEIDSFKFIGTHAFSGKAGELRYEFHNGETYLLGNTDNDKHAEFEVHLHGEIHLVQQDFSAAELL